MASIPSAGKRGIEAIDVAYGKRSADVVGGGDPGVSAAVAGRSGPGGCVVGRPEVLRAVPAVLRPEPGAPVDPDGPYLRLMYLRFRYRLGFEALCVEVADSLAWRRFCRVPLGERVPHPTTLMKITTRCGAEAISQLNEVLLAKAHEEKRRQR